MTLTELFDDFCQCLYDNTSIMTEDNVRYYFFACMLKQDPQLRHYILELPYSSIKKGFNGLILNDGLRTESKGRLVNLELDMYYSSLFEKICAEFKFHRNSGESKSEYPHTLSAGEIFNDIRRLQLISFGDNESALLRRLLIYVTDDEMHNYFFNPENNESKRLFRQNLKNFYTGADNYIPFTGRKDTAEGNKKSKENLTTFMSGAFASFEIPNGGTEYSFEVNTKLIYSKDFICASPSLKKVAYGPNCHVRIFEVYSGSEKK